MQHRILVDPIVVVLGCKQGSLLFYRRVQRAAFLKAKYYVISGTPDEICEGKRLLLEEGIDNLQILRCEPSYNTKENLTKVWDFLGSALDITIVTDNIHSKRVVIYLRKLGLNWKLDFEVRGIDSSYRRSEFRKRLVARIT